MEKETADKYFERLKKEMGLETKAIKHKTTLKLIGIGIGIVAIGLGCIWFSWKLPLVIILAMWGNNIERSNS